MAIIGNIPYFQTNPFRKVKQLMRKTGVTMANLATPFCAEGFSEVQLLWIVRTIIMAFSTAFVPDLAGQCRCNLLGLLVVWESAWGVPTPWNFLVFKRSQKHVNCMAPAVAELEVTGKVFVRLRPTLVVSIFFPSWRKHRTVDVYSMVRKKHAMNISPPNHICETNIKPVIRICRTYMLSTSWYRFSKSDCPSRAQEI